MDTRISSTPTVRVAWATDVGQVRELNEDTVWATTFDGSSPNPWSLAGLLLVADGMGGHDAGEVASGLAGQCVRDLFCSQRPDAPTGLQGQALLARLSGAVRSVNSSVWQRGEEAGGAGASRPGTTLTVALLRADEWMIGHVGDSRAYLFRQGAVEQVTHDDSLVGEAVRRGQMTPEEARDSPFRNQITKAIGLRPEVEPSTYYGHWSEGDVLLLCSDGLSEYLSAADLAAALAAHDDLSQVCQVLVDTANRRGGHDNISVATARCEATKGNSASKTMALSNGVHKPVTWPPTDGASKGVVTKEAVARRVASGRGQETTEQTRFDRDLSTSSSLLKAGVIVLGLLAALIGLFIGMRWGKIPAPAVPAVVAVKAPPTEGASDEKPRAPKTTPSRPATLVSPRVRVSLSVGRGALVLEATGFNINAKTLRLANPVTRLGPSKIMVKLAHYSETQQALGRGEAKLDCLDLATSRPVTDLDSLVGVLSFKPHPGEFVLRYTRTPGKSDELAQFSLTSSKK